MTSAGISIIWAIAFRLSSLYDKINIISNKKSWCIMLLFQYFFISPWFFLMQQNALSKEEGYEYLKNVIFIA